MCIFEWKKKTPIGDENLSASLPITNCGNEWKKKTPIGDGNDPFGNDRSFDAWMKEENPDRGWKQKSVSIISDVSLWMKEENPDRGYKLRLLLAVLRHTNLNYKIAEYMQIYLING